MPCLVARSPQETFPNAGPAEVLEARKITVGWASPALGGGDEDRAGGRDETCAFKVRNAWGEVLVRDRVRDVVPHLLGGQFDRRVEIDSPHVLKVPAQHRLTSLPHEQTLSIRKIASNQLPKLCELTHTVRCRNEPTARAQNARQLRESAVNVRHVVQHEVRGRSIEDPGIERKLLNVPDPRIHPARDCQLNHPRRLIKRDDLDPYIQKPLSKLAAATANLDYPPRANGNDRIEGDVLRLRSAPTSPQRDPTRKASFVSVLTTNGIRIVLLRRDPALIT